MTTELVTSTYTQIAAGIAATAHQIRFLTNERERIQKEYAAAELEEGSFLQFIGEKLCAELNMAISTLEACVQSEHKLLEQKLAEPVEEQLGLGLWQKETV